MYAFNILVLKPLMQYIFACEMFEWVDLVCECVLYGGALAQAPQILPPVLLLPGLPAPPSTWGITAL